MVKKNKSLFIVQCVLLAIIFLSSLEFLFNDFHIYEILNGTYGNTPTPLYLDSIKILPILIAISLLILVIVSCFKIAFYNNKVLNKILNIILILISTIATIIMLISFIKLFTSLNKLYSSTGNTSSPEFGSYTSETYGEYSYQVYDYTLCQEFQANILVNLLVVVVYGILIFVELNLGNNRRPWIATLSIICAVISFVSFGIFGLFTTDDTDKALSYTIRMSPSGGLTHDYKDQIYYQFVNLADTELTNLEITYKYKHNGEEVSNTIAVDSFPAKSYVTLFECDYDGFEFISIVVNCDEYHNLTLHQHNIINSKSRPILYSTIISSALSIVFGLLYYTPLGKRKIKNTELLENPI